MKDANANIQFTQLMPEYVPGIRDDEKAALEALATAKAEFERVKGRYEEISSKHQMFVDEAASSADESRIVNDKIRATLREPYENSHKELITLRAEMRESLEMHENYLFLSNECSASLAEAKMRAEQAANQYRAARAVAAELISENMLAAAIGAANTLFMAMYARVTAFQERRPIVGERDWFEGGFDSAESFVLSDVNTRIARFYRGLDEHYMAQMLPVPLNVPFNVGDLGMGTPASWKMAGVKAKAAPKTSPT